MLPSELLVVWKRRGEILPRYARFSEENLGVAASLIQTYTEHVGEKKKALKAFVSELEDKGYDYRFIRGLTLLLDRRSAFLCDSKVNPADVRRHIFQTAREFGTPTTSDSRARIIQAVASELGLTVDAVEAYFYADLEGELVLEKFNTLTASELLAQYNLSLTQTLLFDSTELSFTTSGNWQRTFFLIKKLGLIYDAYRENGFWVKIDGPASLFKLTRRYGISIAKLLPVIIANPDWIVEAKILWKYTNEICSFRIESRRHGAILKKSSLPSVSFDSFVEEDFAKHFEALKTGWILRREPEPVLAGKQVIIPDFSMERDGVKTYLEIVGFWTQEYLHRKIEKLKKIDAPMLLVINESLACEKLTKLEKNPALELIYYRDKVPLAPILRRLESTIAGVRIKQIEFLKDLQIRFTESVVRFEELAARVGISTEAVSAVLASSPPSGYIATPNSIVREEKLEQIKKQILDRLAQGGKLFLPEAIRLIEAEGGTDATWILNAIGSRVTWHGISVEQAEISKPMDQKA